MIYTAVCIYIAYIVVNCKTLCVCLRLSEDYSVLNMNMSTTAAVHTAVSVFVTTFEKTSVKP